MKSKCETCEGYRDDCQCIEKRLVQALERIALALEMANYREQAKGIPAGSGGVASGYYCTKCLQFVPPGTMHFCGSTYVPPTYPSGAGGTVAKCGVVPNCWLNAGHEGNCVPVTIT